jgi:hypothetical protein
MEVPDIIQSVMWDSKLCSVSRNPICCHHYVQLVGDYFETHKLTNSYDHQFHSKQFYNLLIRLSINIVSIRSKDTILLFNSAKGRFSWWNKNTTNILYVIPATQHFTTKFSQWISWLIISVDRNMVINYTEAAKFNIDFSFCFIS